jgi:hypothetical protein
MRRKARKQSPRRLGEDLVGSDRRASKAARDRASASRCPDSHAYRTGRSASTLETEIAASSLLVGALLEAATASMLRDRYGRKKSLMFSAAMAEDRSTSEGILIICTEGI